MVVKEPRITAKELQAEIQGQGASASNCTSAPFGRQLRKTPFLKEKYTEARLKFAIMHIDKPQSFWENDLWTDESNLEPAGTSHQHYVHR